MNIWKKSKTQYQAGLVRKTGTGRKREYYECEDIESHKTHIVTIEIIENGTTLSCSCTNQSLHQPKGTLCSHMISTIMKKYFDTKIPQ